MKTVWLELRLCLSGCSGQREDELEEHKKHSYNPSSALALLFWVCTNRNLRCSFLVESGDHVCTHSFQLTLPSAQLFTSRQERILCSCVFSKSQKGNQNWFKKKRWEHISVWKWRGSVCSMCLLSYFLLLGQEPGPTMGTASILPEAIEMLWSQICFSSCGFSEEKNLKLT